MEGFKVKGGGLEIFVKFNKWGVGGSEFQKIRNESKKRHRCLILMLKLKVSKQTRSEASKNNVCNNQNSIKYINKLGKSK